MVSNGLYLAYLQEVLYPCKADFSYPFPSSQSCDFALCKFGPQHNPGRYSQEPQICIPKASVLLRPCIAKSYMVEAFVLALKPSSFSTFSFAPDSSLRVSTLV